MNTAARWLSLWLLLWGFLSAAQPAPWIKAIDLRSLTPEEASEGREYRLRGTFIFKDYDNAIFLQDETAGALFWYKDRGPVDLTPGDIIEVQGITKTGLYVPGLDKVTFHVVGHGPVPKPVEVTYDDLVSGRFHYQWITAEGIVRSTSVGDLGKVIIRLAMGSRIVEIHVDGLPDSGSLVDHRIQVTGLAAGGINHRHQLTQPYIWPRDAGGITVIGTPLPLEDLPVVSPGSVLTFHPTARTGHRVKVGGTVLASFPDGRTFIRQDKSALAVKVSAPEALPPGTVITAAGFPEMEGFSASLEDAVIIDRAPGNAPSALPADQRAFVLGSLNHELVTFTATVVESFRTQGGASIVLQNGDLPLRLVSADSETLPARGTLLRITGICDVEASRAVNYNIRPQSVSILARSPADVSVIRSPSWWTTGRLTAALVALAGIFCLAILWIILLRRQVEKQTNALRERIEKEAMMLERQRIAREFHDTLEQDLTGLSLQLGAAAAKSTTGPSRGPLDTARHLVSRIQTETRNLLLDLRTPADQALDLPAALQALADRHPGTTGPRVGLEVAPSLPVLPPRTVHHLRMIAQESVTNAIKHAGASLITISFTQEAARLLLSITDNGRGFDPESETWEKPGHFGCMGIRERSRKLGADVTWRSKPSEGTSVHVTLPISHP